MSPPPGKADDDVRQAILAPAAPAAAGVIVASADMEALVFGRYQVVASIGRGGMGEVYLARVKSGPQKGSLVALKVLIEEQGMIENQDPELIGMFMDEAQIMAQIQHPNVLEVLEFGKERDGYFLAMEYLQGRPLVRVMIDAYSKEQGLDFGVISLIGSHAAAGLHAAHTAKSTSGQPLNVVHRDVSPQNIFVTYAGLTKVIDFGVARASERISHTAAGQLKGKAAYMSPEQTRGQPVDARSDVFSLGICLWEMTAGRRLFKRESEYETMTAVVNAPIIAPTELRGKKDPTLDAIVLEALSRDPKKRTQSAGVLAERLGEYARRAGMSDRIAPVTTLMKRLYGKIAEEELAVIAAIQNRAATEAEEDALRRLSGVSPRPGPSTQITLAGRPSELSELDDFGSINDEDDATEALSRKSLHKHAPDAPTAKTLSAVVGEAPRDASQSRGDAIRKAVEQLHAQQQAETARAQVSASNIPTYVKPKRPWGELLAPVMIGVTAFIGLVALILVATSSEEVVPIAPEPEPANVHHLDPVEVEPVADPPLEPPPPPKPTLSGVLDQLAAAGVPVVRGEVQHTIGAPPVAIAATATVVEVTTPSAKGFALVSNALHVAGVSWMGSVRGGQAEVHALSINDCPAKVNVQPVGLEITYGQKTVMLPHGGGVLVDKVVQVPSFARRAELQPLALGFGILDVTRSVTHCPSGWENGRLELQRIPPGEYTLTWIGNGLFREEPLVVRAEDAGRPPEVVPAAAPGVTPSQPEPGAKRPRKGKRWVRQR